MNLSKSVYTITTNGLEIVGSCENSCTCQTVQIAENKVKESYSTGTSSYSIGTLCCETSGCNSIFAANACNLAIKNVFYSKFYLFTTLLFLVAICFY